MSVINSVHLIDIASDHGSASETTITRDGETLVIQHGDFRVALSLSVDLFAQLAVEAAKARECRKAWVNRELRAAA